MSRMDGKKTHTHMCHGEYVYICMDEWSSHIARVRIGKAANPDRGFSLSLFAPENLVSRDGFNCPVLRQLAHSPHSFRLNLENTLYVFLPYGVFLPYDHGLDFDVSLLILVVQSINQYPHKTKLYGNPIIIRRWGADTLTTALYVYLSLTCVFCYSCSFLFVVCVFVFFFALIGAW